MEKRVLSSGSEIKIKLEGKNGIIRYWAINKGEDVKEQYLKVKEQFKGSKVTVVKVESITTEKDVNMDE